MGWKNRNTFRAGEILSVNANYGVEVQYSGRFQGFNTMRYGAEANLVFPRFLVPFFNFNTRGGYMPRTKASISYDILNRTKLFSMNSFSFNFGYNWKENARKEHELIPFNITYVNPVNVTDEYLDAARKNADFILDSLSTNGRLLRTWKDGRAKLNAYIEDYSNFADGLKTYF